ncbi:hypothetical protein VPHD81_0121 [Vibrio phage D81]
MQTLSKEHALFRGRRIDKDEYVYGYHMKLSLGDQTYVHAIQEVDKRGTPVPIQVHPDSVCMFTGTQDMYDKDVYEGDKVRSMGANNITGKVIFWKGAFWIDGEDRAGEVGRDLLYRNCVKLNRK